MGFINLFKWFPKICMKFVLQISSVAIKNGNKVGTIEFDHNINPSFAAVKFVLENNIRKIRNNKNIIVKKFFFNEITKKRIISSNYINIYSFF